MGLIALDADGVLLDYNAAYADVWERAFNVRPKLINPDGYHATDRYEVPSLEGTELQHFRSFFDEQFWSTVPPISGALEACQRLAKAGHPLVCVSALPTEFAAARLRNLQSLGFPIDAVFATPQKGLEPSPKAIKITELAPVAFVDDYVRYLHGVPVHIHRALIVRDPCNSPNNDPLQAHFADSRHLDLLQFSQWWLTQAEPNRAN
jgi:phosphoglycolate phosphatase-like HAD superfamily hydrolase